MKLTMPSQTLHGLFEAAAIRYNSNTALVSDQGERADVLTYEALAFLSSKLAEETKRHVKKENEVIAVMGGEFDKVMIAILGILKVPAAFTFIPRHYPKKKTTKILTQVEATLIITSEDISEKEEPDSMKFLQTTFKTSTEVVVLEGIKKTCFNFVHLVPIHPRMNNQGQIPLYSPLAYVVFTSGTTGDPKMVKVPHQCIVPNILHLRELFSVRPSDVIFNAAPLTFDPSIVEIFLALSSGAKLVAVSNQTKASPNRLISVLVEHRVTILQTTPSLLFRVNPESLKSTILSSDSSMRVLAFGGETCPSLSRLSECFHQDNKTEIYNLYGITEVSSWATCHRLQRELTENGDHGGEMESVPLGEPLLETILEVRDDQGVTLTTNGEGQLFIGSSTRICYIGDDRHIEGEPVFRATGDYVRKTPAGLLFLGRRDDQVKRFGKRFNLSQVAKTVESFPEVLSCQAVLDNSYEPPRLYAFYIRTEDSSHETTSFQETEDGKRLKVRLKEYVSEEAIPDRIFTLNTFPVTHHGKLNTEYLKLRTREYLQQQCSSPGGTSIEQIVECHIKEMLFISVGLDRAKSFIQLGGNSFQAVNLVELLERHLRKTNEKLLDSILHQSIEEVITLLNQTAEDSRPPELTEKSQSDAAVAVEALFNPEHDMDDQSHNHVSMKPKTKTEELLLTEHLEERTINVDGDQVKRRKLCHKDVINRTTVLRRGSAVTMGENISMVTQEMTDGAQLSMKENWSLDLEKCIDASPLVVTREGIPDIIVYIGSHSGIFVGLDLETGRRLWQVRLPDRMESSACFSVRCNLVVVGCYDHHIYFLDAMTGSVYWMFRTLGPVKSSPTSDLVTGLVYVGSHDGNVYALQPQTKTCQWSMSDGGGSMFSSPCIDSWNNSVYAASLSGKLLSISKDTGDVKWYYQCPKPLFSSPVVAIASVVIGCVDGSIYNISHSGKLLRRIPTEAPIFSSPCLVTLDNREIILVGSHDGHVYSINLHEGTTLWKTKIGKHVYSSPSCIFNNIDTRSVSEIGNRSEMESGKESSKALSRAAGNGLVCCCSTTGTLVILDLKSGKELTSHVLPGEIFSSPLLMEDGRIILGCRNNMIYSFSLDTG